ncbi:MAG: spore coat protein CotJB [Bacillota bacterium]|nr:spore coat protein CotJB [Bacillota bacterium]
MDENRNPVSREELVKKMQELTFAAVDLNLYLDNHPDNREALGIYNKIYKELTDVKKIYEMKYGALSNFGCSPSQCPWTWIDEPWPWEIGE